MLNILKQIFDNYDITFILSFTSLIISFVSLLVTLANLKVAIKIKKYTENSNLSSFNKNLIDGKLVFITALKEAKENKVVFDFAVETLLNICENGCFFYYKGHYNKGDFIKLFKDDIVKYYISNYADISNVKLNKDYPNLVKFYLEHKKTNY